MLGALALSSLVALAGCARGCTSSRPPIHLNPSMDDQPKVLPQTASDFFYDGSSMREPVPGTVPIGGLKEDTAFFTGKGADGQFVASIPVTVDEAVTSYRTETEPTPVASPIPEGVYVYSTRGYEKTDALTGVTHRYPKRSTITVAARECGVSLTWRVLQGRSTEWLYCTAPQGWELRSQAPERIGSTLSVGLALAVEGESDEAMVARADAALYEVKRQGRGGVIVAPPGIRPAV